MLDVDEEVIVVTALLDQLVELLVFCREPRRIDAVLEVGVSGVVVLGQARSLDVGLYFSMSLTIIDWARNTSWV